MRKQKLVEICEREYIRGEKSVKVNLKGEKVFDYNKGYADAFKLCLALAKELPEENKKIKNIFKRRKKP